MAHDIWSKRRLMLAAVAGLCLVGVASAEVTHRVDTSLSPDQVADALGPAQAAVLTEAVAMRTQPLSRIQPGLHVPAGTPVQAYRELYNRDGHWRYIGVDDTRGWVPMDSVALR